MKSLADRILAVTPSTERGLSFQEAIEHTSQDRVHVRAAFEQLAATGRVQIIRRGKGRGGAMFLVLPEIPIRACAHCRREVTAKRKETRTCSHSCARFLAWQNEDMRARHKASSLKAGKLRGAKIRANGKMKAICNTPEKKDKLARDNRRSWADPESRARRELAIKEAWQGDKAKARRDRQRLKKLALWNDPEWKAKTVAAMQTGKRGRFKRAVIALANEHPTLSVDEIAFRVGLSAEQVKIIWRRSYRLGELDRLPPDGRKRKQTDEEIRHRVRLSTITKTKRATGATNKPPQPVSVEARA